MGVLVCPRCRETFAGVVDSGWLTCLGCQHRWLPSPTQTVSTASLHSLKVKDVPVAIALPPPPPKHSAPISSAGSAAVTESDEYSPNDSGEMKRRTAALTNRQGPAQAHESDVDPSTVPAAIPIAAGTDPFDPDLFAQLTELLKKKLMA